MSSTIFTIGDNKEVVLKVKGLHTSLFNSTGKAWLKVVRNLNFTVKKNQLLAIVGESGCGKSVTALSILRLLDPDASQISGEVFINGKDVLSLNITELEKIRGRRVAMIFQDPMTSLNPVKRIGDLIIEAISLHSTISKSDARKEAIRLLDEVQIPSPKRCLMAYPHELSGGMRQRVMIAMALSMKPDLIIADEPTTALDVTVQAQVIKLFKERVKSHRTATILITHDIALVSGFADEILVMYAGRIVEYGPIERVLMKPAHPYTAGLLASLCTLESQPRDRLTSIPGNPPQPDNIPNGCAFHPRCLMAIKKCATEMPPMRTGHFEDQGAAECHKAWNIKD